MIEKSPKPGTELADRSPKSGEHAAGTTSYEVEIAGVPLRLKSNHDRQTVNELVDLVNSKIREALPLTRTGSIQNASILASLNLAEEYVLLKRKAKAELERLEAKALKVVAELESSRLTGLNDESRASGQTRALDERTVGQGLDH